MGSSCKLKYLKEKSVFSGYHPCQLVNHHVLKMGAEMVPEKSVIFSQPTRLTARDFISFSRYENFGSYI
jgi:hypothetical protein